MWGGGAVPHFIDLQEFYFNEAVIVKIGTQQGCTVWQVICNSFEFIVPNLSNSKDETCSVLDQHFMLSWITWILLLWYGVR